jgi:hypothetical protein
LFAPGQLPAYVATSQNPYKATCSSTKAVKIPGEGSRLQPVRSQLVIERTP